MAQNTNLLAGVDQGFSSAFPNINSIYRNVNNNLTSNGVAQGFNIESPEAKDLITKLLSEKQGNALFGYNEDGTPADFGFNKGTFNTVGQGLGALANIAKMYFGAKELKQGRKEFGIQKDFANRNLANEATTVNGRLEDIYRARLANSGKPVTDQAVEAYLSKRKVDGTPIG